MLVKKTLQYSYPQVDTIQFYARSGEEFQQPSVLPYSLGQLVCGWFKCATERLAGSSATKPGLVLCLPGRMFEPQAWKARIASGNSKSPGWFKNRDIETRKYRRETIYDYIWLYTVTCSDSKTKDLGEKRKSKLHRQHRFCLKIAALVWEINPISDNPETRAVGLAKDVLKCCPEEGRVCSGTYHLFLNLGLCVHNIEGQVLGVHKGVSGQGFPESQIRSCCNPLLQYLTTL